LGWPPWPKVPLCTKAKCAVSKEFSISRSAPVFQVSSNWWMRR
jgi:hypothetical protein